MINLIDYNPILSLIDEAQLLSANNNKYIMNNSNLKSMLLTHIGATRIETVDYIWTVLASRNVQMAMDNKEEVLREGKNMFNNLMKRW
jgi:translation initiation factor 2B subunit (eIF-2B alpha/beta/delta family)